MSGKPVPGSASSFRAFSGWQTACRTVLTGRAGNVLHYWFWQEVLTRPCCLHPSRMSQRAEELAGAWQPCSGLIQRQMRRPNSPSLIELPNNVQGCRKVSEWTFQPPWKVRETEGQDYGRLVRSRPQRPFPWISSTQWVEKQDAQHPQACWPETRFWPMNASGNCFVELIQNSQFLNSGHTSGFGVL